MATPSSVLAWRIPGMGEPGGLPAMGSHRVRHDIVLAGIAVLCLVSYLLAKGAPAVGLTTEQPDASTLKLTDTILNLTYITGAASILAIIFGEVVMAIRNK